MEADWNLTKEADDGLWVPLNEAPDSAWRNAFAQVNGLWESETRGQTWDGIELSADGSALYVSGIDSETRSHDLRTYVADLLGAVDREADAERQREARNAEQMERDAATRSEHLSRLADELRDEG